MRQDDNNSHDEDDDINKIKLLLPHLVLAVVCLVFLAFNFWCYRRSNNEKYRRKMEKLEQDLMSNNGRRVTSMARYSSPSGPALPDVTSVSPDGGVYDVNSNSTGGGVYDVNSNTTGGGVYDVISNSTGGDKYAMFSCGEERQRDDLLTRSDTPDYYDASSAKAKENKGLNQSSSGDKSRRKKELPPVQMPLGLFTSPAGSSKSKKKSQVYNCNTFELE